MRVDDDFFAWHLQRSLCAKRVGRGEEEPPDELDVEFDVRAELYRRHHWVSERLEDQSASAHVDTELTGALVRLSVFELGWDYIRGFDDFSRLMRALWGDAIGSYLVSIYLAAIHRPLGPAVHMIDLADAASLIGRAEVGRE